MRVLPYAAALLNMMNETDIERIEVDSEGRLHVRPAHGTFELIYRAAGGVSWNPKTKTLVSAVPRDWSLADWFRQIRGVVDEEYEVRLMIRETTEWVGIPNDMAEEIRAVEY